MQNKKIRLVHISTDEVYGDIPEIRGLMKLSLIELTYSAKSIIRSLVYSYVRTYKMDAVISNCSNNYGPRQFQKN